MLFSNNLLLAHGYGRPDMSTSAGFSLMEARSESQSTAAVLASSGIFRYTAQK
jgi:hypothetical protein